METTLDRHVDAARRALENGLTMIAQRHMSIALDELRRP